MVTVVGNFNGGLNGEVVATPSSPFVNPSNPNELIINPFTTLIISGSFRLEISQSTNLSSAGKPTEEVSYKWEVFKTENVIEYYLESGELWDGANHTHTDGFVYTGIKHTDNSQILAPKNTTKRTPVIEPFYASVPDSTTDINFQEIVGTTPRLPYVDISLYRLADILTSNPNYRNQLSTKFILQGVYDPSAIYEFGNIVRFDGGSYAWVNENNGNSQPPLNSDNSDWIQVSAKGDPGGTGATSIGYNRIIWQASNDSASRRDVSQALEQLRNDLSTPAVDLSAYLTKAEGVPRNNPVFTGVVKQSTVSYPVSLTNKPTVIPTVEYVEKAIQNIDNGLLPKPLIYARKVNSINITKDVPTPMPWDNRILGLDLVDTTGKFRLEKTGFYLLFISLSFELNGVIGANNTRSILRVYLQRTNPAPTDTGSFIYDNTSSTAGQYNFIKQGLKLENVDTENSEYEIRIITAGAGLGNSHKISPDFPPGTNSYFAVFKIF